MGKTVVLGVGNLLMSDEGLGVYAVNKLKKEYYVEEGVDLIDGGTVGLGLTYFLSNADRLIIVDAIKGGKPAGTLYKFKNEEVYSYFSDKVSFHDLGIQEVLAILNVIGKNPKEIVVLGLEPMIIDMGIEMSEPVKRNMDRLIEELVNQLKEWGFEVRKRDPICL